MSDYNWYSVKVFENGSRFWFMNNKRHREDGPSAEYADGTKRWYLNDELHREDGPAIEWADGGKDWYLKGNHYTESNYKAEMVKRNNTCDGKIVTIEGKEYTLTEVKR